MTVMYDLLFEGRDPVAEPGTSDGTPGDWWTVFALVPDVLEHAVQGFGLYQSPKRLLDPVLRELAQARVGWAAGSQFVYSQHCKSLRALGVSEEAIAAVPHWAAADRLRRDPATRTGLHRLPRARPRPGARRAVRRAPRVALSDEEILELTYITTLYLQHAVMSRALRTEFDDRPEPVVEVVVEGADNTGAGRPGRHPRPTG